MLKQIISATKIVMLAIVLSFGLSYALAWTSPTATPPGANVDAPINAGATDQEKTGGLTANSFTTTGLTPAANTVTTRSLFTTASSSIGTVAQTQTLTVAGTIGATEDICTAAGGGKCLSTVSAGGGIDPAPIGSIVSYAGETAPSGYLICNGAVVSRTTYADLFAAIGTTYGAGNGTTTFKIPDLRGEFIRGFSNGRAGVDVGRIFGSTQAQDVQSHAHNVPVGYRPDYLGNGTWAGTGVVYPGYNTASAAYGGTETRPRNVAMNYIIKAVNNSEMVLVVGGPVTSITAGTGITITPVGPNATGDVTINASAAAIPAGAVMYFNLASCPVGWVAANGTGGTPDLRGEFIRGLDSGRGIDIGRTLASAQADVFKSHTHTYMDGGTRGGSGGIIGGYPTVHNLVGTTSATGDATETRPRNVALLACVKS